MRILKLAFLAVLTLIGVAAFVSLGTWQLELRTQKLALVERFQTRIHSEPVPFLRARELWAKDGDVEYYRVQLAGRFLHEHERYLYTVLDGQEGWSVIVPLVTGAGDIVLVDRGFVPNDRRDPATRNEGLVGDTVDLTGVARGPATKALFTPINNQFTNRWYWRNVPALVASMRGVDARKVAPFVVEADASPVPGGWPRGGITRVDLPNRHLEYALASFGLAAELVAIFWFSVRKRGRGAQ